MAFLDPSNFSLDPEGMQSFQQRIAELRSTLPPSVAAAQPPISGQPLPVNPAQSINDLTVRQLRHMGQSSGLIPTQASPTLQDMQAQIQSQYGALATPMSAQQAPSDQSVAPPTSQPAQPPSTEQLFMDNLRQYAMQVQPKAIEVLMKQAQDIGPPKLIGGDPLNFGRGGIMGTGVEPLDVLAFALGIGLTWNLPHDKAQEMTWKIAGMPRAYKEAQRNAAQEFYNQTTSGLTALTGAANAARRQTGPTHIPAGSLIPDPDNPGKWIPAGPATPRQIDLGNLRESIALARYGKSTAQLSPAELTIVNAAALKHELDLASGRAGARRDIELETQGESLLTPGEASQLDVPYGTRRKEATGKKPLTIQARNTIQAMGAAEAALNKIEDAAFGELDKRTGKRKGGAITAATAAERAMQTPGAIVGGLTQSEAYRGPELVRLRALGEGLLATFSRSVGGERGHTTEEDVKRARGLIPSVFPVPDTIAVARQKVKDMRELIAEIKARAGGIEVAPPSSPVHGPGRLVPVPPSR